MEKMDSARCERLKLKRAQKMMKGSEGLFCSDPLIDSIGASGRRMYDVLGKGHVDLLAH
jgi:hypothetical protein